MPAVERDAFFLDTPGGARFTLVTRPTGAIRGSIVFIPPFAEELNKSRRMCALAAEAFARDGWQVVQADLFGTGDSPGDFGEATWAHWIEDLDATVRWVETRGQQPVMLWALRAGALLAGEWNARAAMARPCLMWQPVTNGKQHLTQFLRLKSAADMLSESDAKSTPRELAGALEAGEAVEVAGYTLNPGLASGMNAAKLETLDRAHVIELAGEDRLNLSPAVSRLVEKTAAGDASVKTAVVAGPAFWQTLEIEVAPNLVPASLDALAGLMQA